MMKIKGKRFVASIEPIGLLNGSAIAPVTMKQQAYELIKDAILYRRLQIGITYSQDALCSELNISRTPVREALLELQQEGYIAYMRGKGIQVIPITKKRAQDIVEARYYLELNGARLAAQRGIAVISGGARGCDAAAHEAALSEGAPTVAFLGGGYV